MLLLLLTLATATAVFAPTYATSVKQATIRAVVLDALPSLSGVRVSTLPTRPMSDAPAPAPETLAEAIPAGLGSHLLPAVPHRDVAIAAHGRGGMRVSGTLTARADQCHHVRISSGRCPAAWGDVLVSGPDAALHDWKAGSTLAVTELLSYHPAAPNGPRSLTVVGTYTDPDQGSYWFGDPLLGSSGRVEDRVTLLDTVLTDEATLAQTDPRGGPAWVEATSSLDRAIDAASIGLDDVAAMRQDATRLSGISSLDRPTGRVPVLVTTQLPALLDDALTGTAQVDLTIPVLAVELGLLLGIATSRALAAAVTARRGALAFRRLHGTPADRVTRAVSAELLSLLLVALPCGVGLGLLLRTLASRRWLGQDTELVTDARVIVILGSVAAGLAGLIVVAVRHQARLGVADLLRRTPQRTRPRATGTTILAAVALAGFVALTTGSLTGPIGTAGPLLLALGVGLLAASGIGPACETWAHRSLRAGRPAQALAALNLSRRLGVRELLTVVTVATGLLVFVVEVLSVGARNIDLRARAEVGAPAVVTTVGARVSDVRAALAEVDPTQHTATITATVSSAGRGGISTVGIDPQGYARIAYLPTGAASGLDRIRVPERPAVTWTGRLVTARLDSTGQAVLPTDLPEPPPTPTAAALQLDVVDASGARFGIQLSPIPPDSVTALPVSAALACGTGCRVVGLRVAQESGQPPVRGRITLRSLAVDGKPVSLGDAADWSRVDGPSAQAEYAGSAAESTISYTLRTVTAVTMTRSDDPATLPAVLAGEPPAGSSAEAFTGPGLDRVGRRMTAVATWPYIPGAPPDAALVDLSALSRSGVPPRDVQVAVLLDDPTSADRVTAALRGHHIEVGPVRRASDVAAGHQRQPAAWSARLGIVVGVLAVVVALLVLGVLAASTWRARVADDRALRAAGVAARTLHRAVLLEQVTLLTVGVGLGAVAGAIGAVAGLPLVPIFLRPPAYGVLDLGLAWPAILMATAATWTLTLAVALLAVSLIGRRNEPGGREQGVLP